MSRIVQVIILRRHSGCFIKVYQWQCARHKKCHFKKPSLRHDPGRCRLGVTSPATQQPVLNSTTKLVPSLAFLTKSDFDILFLHNDLMVYLYLFRFLSIVIQIRMKASFIESKVKAERILCLSPSLSASKIPAYPRSAAAGP